MRSRTRSARETRCTCPGPAPTPASVTAATPPWPPPPELLVEGGPERVTHATVAQRAGVGRATVYRQWPDQQTLLLDALANGARPLLTFDDGPFRDQLVTQLQQQAEWLNQSVTVSVISTIIERAERDEDVRRIRETMFGRTDQPVAEALAAAVRRGEFRPGIEEHAVDLASHVLGPLFFQRFMLGVRLGGDLVIKVVDTALAPWLPTS